MHAPLPFGPICRGRPADADLCVVYGYQPNSCSCGQQSKRSTGREMSYRQRINSCVQTLQISRFVIHNSGNPIQSSRHPIQNATALMNNAVAAHRHLFPGWKTARAGPIIRGDAVPGVIGVGRRGTLQTKFPSSIRQLRATALPMKLWWLTTLRHSDCSGTSGSNAIFTGELFVPCKRSLQTRSDDGTANNGRAVVTSGGTAG